ncbi:MAG TPA: ABC transporter ATP-binding protein [Casimicrobiaceae bacterium]|nr:ABC transporter ATP-binding protein [Casimicrobiaceae bacterium]
MEPLLSVRNLRVSFRLDKHTAFEAVKGVSFDIPKNATVALVGESGSGKSVTSLSILGLLPKENALVLPGSEIQYGGRNLVELDAAELRKLRGADVSMIFQEPMTSLNPVFTVGYQLGEVLQLHMGLAPRQANERAIALLDEVGIPDPAYKVNAYPSQMSGGQQQRVMIAMAIACEPKLLIADEPTTALDVTIQKQILDLIAALQKKHQMSVLFITHDLAVVGEIADYVVVMRNGEIREQGPAKSVFENPQDAYTKALLQCRPRLDRRPVRLPVIEDFMDGGAHAMNLNERKRGVLSSDPIILDVRKLGKDFYTREGVFGQRRFQAVKDVSFRLPKGKTLGLVGESGSGKTTVGLTLMRLHEASSGEALFEGRDILSMSPREFMAYKRRIQIIFQNPYASLNPRFVIGQILTEPMMIHGIGASAQERTDLAFEMLHKVGLPEVSFYKYPHEFSGGQRQRIAIARCLTLKPDILICDESVSALDVSVQAQVLNLLQALQDEFHLSYIFISHDLAVVKYISDEVMVMNQGEIVEIANSDEIYRHPQQPYTKKLLSAIPKGWHHGGG